MASISQETRLRLSDLFPEEIAQQLEIEPFRGRQIFRWIHQKKAFAFDAMTDLSKDLRHKLSETCVLPQIQPVHRADSKQATGTHKTLFRLDDGDTVEAVFLQQPQHITLCLSSQVGCAIKCTFCATGFSGYTRNLRAGEIVEQALHLLAESETNERTPNIVFMGMGEPFRNYDGTLRAIRLLMHPDGLNIGARKITISTVGEAPGILRFAQEGLQVRLSVSLHAGNDTLRSKLVPLNRKYPLNELMNAIETYCNVTGRKITFEWTLLKDVNDSPEDAAELINLARHVDAKVNLIPYNPVSGLGYEAPQPRSCQAFAQRLERAGIPVTLRIERGQDISAACGQLRRQHEGLPV